MSGTFVPTYESCSTATFLHGRTETVRPLTCESRAFVEAFNAASDLNEVSNKKGELFKLLRAASLKHRQLTELASGGYGWDRHLFALQNLSRSKSDKAVPMFQDEAYTNINKILMSTSTVRVSQVVHAGFCPVHPDGYGVSYMGVDDYFGCYISSYGDKCGELRRAMEDTMKDFTRLLK